MRDQKAQQILGNVIRTAREVNGLSQEALADAAGLHRTYISLLERGLRNPSLVVLVRLAAALGISAAELVARFEMQTMERAG
jgi:transcriptional regulator with XRE-family HTH domain